MILRATRGILKVQYPTHHRQMHVNVRIGTSSDQDLKLVSQMYSALGFKTSQIQDGSYVIATHKYLSVNIRRKYSPSTSFFGLVNDDQTNRRPFNIDGIHVETNGCNSKDGNPFHPSKDLRAINPPYFAISMAGYPVADDVDLSTAALEAEEEQRIGEYLETKLFQVPDSNVGPNWTLKEVVIPCGEENHQQLTSTRLLIEQGMERKAILNCPNVYPIFTNSHCKDIDVTRGDGMGERSDYDKNRHFYLRALPSDICTIVLHVDSIDEFRRSVIAATADMVPAERAHIEWEWIGQGAYNADSSTCSAYSAATGRDQSNGEHQLQILSPSLCGLDVRVTESAGVTAFFNEGQRSLLHGTISSIQSARVMGGDASVVESKYGYAGDCWVEARAIAKQGFKSTAMSTAAAITTAAAAATATVSSVLSATAHHADPPVPPRPLFSGLIRTARRRRSLNRRREQKQQQQQQQASPQVSVDLLDENNLSATDKVNVHWRGSACKHYTPIHKLIDNTQNRTVTTSSRHEHSASRNGGKYGSTVARSPSLIE